MRLELAEYTRQLEQLYAAGERYRVIEYAHCALAELPLAPNLAALTLQSLVDLGLGGPAQELLQFRRDLPNTPQVEALRAAVKSSPHGRVRWSERADVFARNADAVCAHRPEMGELFASARDILSGLHLYRGRDGAYRISRREPGRLREWLPDSDGTAGGRNGRAAAAR